MLMGTTSQELLVQMAKREHHIQIAFKECTQTAKGCHYLVLSQSSVNTQTNIAMVMVDSALAAR